jgi:hypothetical protein
MGARNSEVGYTSATTRRGDHEVYMDVWWHWGEFTNFKNQNLNACRNDKRVCVNCLNARLSTLVLSIINLIPPSLCAIAYSILCVETISDIYVPRAKIQILRSLPNVNEDYFQKAIDGFTFVSLFVSPKWLVLFRLQRWKFCNSTAFTRSLPLVSVHQYHSHQTACS